jgi:hypothetical protein
MSVKPQTCPKCGAESLPGQEVCKARGQGLGSSRTYKPRFKDSRPDQIPDG